MASASRHFHHMDPALWELIEEGTQDEIDAVIRLHDASIVPDRVRVITQFGPIITVRVKRDDIVDVHRDNAVVSFKASKSLTPDIELYDDTIMLSPAAIEHQQHLRRPPGIVEKGEGTVIGFIDWGCDFTHPDFIDNDGNTRFIAIWDQRQHNDDLSENKYGRGRIFTREQINDALQGDHPFEELDYTPYDSDLGFGSHGTHTLAIAAGNGNGGGPSGVAPKADLVFVHASGTSARGTRNLGDSVSLLEAIDFIRDIADGRPCLVNCSLGSHAGSHDGKTPFEVALDHILQNNNNFQICNSAGNYFRQNIHASGFVSPEQSQTLVLRINRNDYTDNEVEVWYSQGDQLKAEISAPNGSLLASVPLGELSELVFEDELVGRVYHRRNDPNNGDNLLDIFIYGNAPHGNWEITLSVDGQQTEAAPYHAWIERDPTGLNNQSHFASEISNPNTTTGTICNGYFPLTVGAYDPQSTSRQLGSFSSSGPTRDLRQKPELVAPGVGIVAARSSPFIAHADSALYTAKSGTSMAAPHVTGCCSLVMQAADSDLSTEQIRTIILDSTDPVDEGETQPQRIGHGYLNIQRAVETARQFRAGTRTYADQRASENQVNEKESAMNTEPFSENNDASPGEMDNTDYPAPPDVPAPPISLAEPGGEESEVTEQQAQTNWNAYIYVVGSDRSGGGDFNIIRRQLQSDIRYQYPWVAMTYDFSQLQLRKRWMRSASSSPVDQTYRLNIADFSILYRHMHQMPAHHQTIRHFHVLTHFGENHIMYQWERRSSFSNLTSAISGHEPEFRRAFASDAIVKIHGCQADDDTRGLIIRFCRSGTSVSDRRSILSTLHTRIGDLFPYRLAHLIRMPVWATPIGAGSEYNCSYLPPSERGKRFCIEISPSATYTRRGTVLFFRSNYDQFFNVGEDEAIFDSTYHMKYKSQLRSVSTYSPSPCATTMSREAESMEAVFESRETDNPVENQQIPATINGVLSAADDYANSADNWDAQRFLLSILSKNNIAPESSVTRISDPAFLYDAVMTNRVADTEPAVRDLFSVVAKPGQLLNNLRAGDIVVRRANESLLSHVAVVTEDKPIRLRQANDFSHVEPARAGTYARVIEPGAFPHNKSAGYARRIGEEHGCVDNDTLILRLRGIQPDVENYDEKFYENDYEPPEELLTEATRAEDQAATLRALSSYVSRTTSATHSNALAILQYICLFHNIPWRIAYVVLQHEGGVRLFRHPDGVMQTTRPARNHRIPRIPVVLKRKVLGLPATNASTNAQLNRQMHSEFRRRLAVQIAVGVQELKDCLDEFNGYVALAYVAYNAGAGWAYHVVNNGRSRRRPTTVTPANWETQCRIGASILHQPIGTGAGTVYVDAAWYQCDHNIPAWFRAYRVRDRGTRIALVAYQYLRRLRAQIHQNRPTVACTAAVHGAAHRQPGTGPLINVTTRQGALDKMYNPNLLGRAYYNIALVQLPAINDDGLPLKSHQGNLVKAPLTSSASGTTTYTVADPWAAAQVRNDVYGPYIGWDARTSDISSRLLGFTSSSPGPLQFAQAVSRWQSTQSLPATGDIDGATWRLMQARLP